MAIGGLTPARQSTANEVFLNDVEAGPQALTDILAAPRRHDLIGSKRALLLVIACNQAGRRQNRSTNTLSRQAPLPSIEMAISAFFSTAVKSMDVNCDPWSVLKMSGLP